MKSCKEKAAEWGISSRAVNDMCKKGKVAGAVKENGTWRISGGGERTEQAVADFRIAFAREVGTGSGIGGSGRKYQPGFLPVLQADTIFRADR